MNKIYILAGTYEQFKWFVRQLENTMFSEGIPFRHSDFVYVTPDSIRGHRNIWGYKVGTWRERKDSNQLQQLIGYTFSSVENDFIEVEL